MKKNLIGLIALGTVCSYLFTSCGKSVIEEKELLFVGTHDFTAPETDKYLVRNGETDYKVVIPDGATPKERTAREELSYFFKIATGVELFTYEDDDFDDLSTLNHYISIGHTQMFKDSGIDAEYEELGTDGCRVVTKGDNIFITGALDSGTLYSVYDFLKVTFNYNQYTPGYYEIDKDLKDVKLRNYNIKDIPDIGLRANGFGYHNPGSSNYDYSNFGYRMRMEKGRGYHFMPVFRLYDYSSQSATSTNTNTYIPWDVWGSEHPKWFSDKCSRGKEQLCYTAHGDAEERKALVEEVAKKIEFSCMRFLPEDYPDMNVITFTMEDNFNTCECPTCTAQSEKYGAQAGPLNVFVNDVGALVEEWMNKEENAQYKRDDFHIIYFAYNAYEPAPAYKDAEGNWQPTYPEVKLRSNVGVYFAEINIIDYQKSFFHPDNQMGKDAFDAWESISDFMYYWTYETNFSLLMYFYDTFDFYTQEMYNYVASKRLDMFFGEAQEFCGTYGTNWNGLKGYLDSKLAWDTTLNQEELMKDYFRAVFGDAQYEMRELFDLIRVHNAELLRDHPDLSQNRSCYNAVRYPDYFPLTTLENFIAKADHAKLAIKKLENTNPKLYKELYKHIEAEAFNYLYIILDLHSGKITFDRKMEILDRLYEDIDLLSLQNMQIKEAGSTVLSIVDGWKKTL